MNREELIKLAEQLISNGCSEELKDALVKEYPELAKSEDEKMLDGLIADLQSASFVPEYVSSVEEWIKKFITLHTDTGWKPSDAQMKALNQARITAEVGDFAILDSLYADLTRVKQS